MVKLWGSLDRVPPMPPTNLRVAEIGRDDAARFEETVLPAIEVPPELGPIIRAGIGRPGWRYYLAFDGTDAIAGIVLFVHGTAAWMGFAATRAEHRGQGAQTTLIVRASADARAMGARWVSGETYSEADAPAPSVRLGARLDGKSLYERQNFVFFTKPVSS
jgi:GNAT superfamily N-acetyltransferase